MRTIRSSSAEHNSPRRIAQVLLKSSPLTDSLHTMVPSPLTPNTAKFSSTTQSAQKKSDDAPLLILADDADNVDLDEDIVEIHTMRRNDALTEAPLTHEQLIPRRVVHHHVGGLSPVLRSEEIDAADSHTSDINPDSQITKEATNDPHSPVTSNSPAPNATLIDHPVNDTIFAHDATIQDPNHTVIMAQNAIIINNMNPTAAAAPIHDENGNVVETTTTTEEDPSKATGKVKRTRDGRTKIVGGDKNANKNIAARKGDEKKVTKETTVVKETNAGKDDASRPGAKDTTIVETKKETTKKNDKKTEHKTTVVEKSRDPVDGVKPGNSPMTPMDGRHVDRSTTTLARVASSPRDSPHSPQTPGRGSPVSESSYSSRTPGSPSNSVSSYSTYSIRTPVGVEMPVEHEKIILLPRPGASPLVTHVTVEERRAPFMARTPGGRLITGSIASPTSSSYSSYTSVTPQSALRAPGSAVSRDSRVSFNLPPGQRHRDRAPRHGAQVVGDRVAPGLPSIYSPDYSEGGSTSPASGSPTSVSTSSSRARSVASKPPSNYPRAQTPVVRETRELKTVNRQVQFFSKNVEQVAGVLTVDVHRGLDDGEASNRIGIFGPNQLKKEKKVSPIRLFLGQLITTLNVILIVAGIGAIVSAVVEGSYGWIEGIVILFIIVSNSIIGFSQEYRSAKTLESLMNMFAPEAEVIRGGQRKTIAADQLVPGDIVLLEDGDCVPADLRLIETVNLTIDEAVITGESEPVNKITDAIKAEEAEAIGDRKNMAFMSTVVCGGRGKGLVVRTGEDTELGQIAEKLRSSDKDKRKTHLQQSMSKLGYALLFFALGLSVIVLAIQVLAVGTEAFTERYTWLYIVALCVAIIPEGLPAVLALTLAMGMRQMAKKNAIVRKLAVLESLNWITDICSDKTGTLTEGKMMATMMWAEDTFFKVSGTGIIPEGQITEKGGSVVTVETLAEDRTLTMLLYTCSLCNMATLTHQDDEWTATSSPTEIALQVLAYKAGLGKPFLERQFKFLGEHPFDSNSKRMSVAYERRDEPLEEDPRPEDREAAPSSSDPSKTILFMKGSLESVTKMCAYYKDEDGDEIEFDDDIMQTIQEQAEAMAGLGLRVLSFAYKYNFKFDPNDKRENNDQGATFLGLVGIMDPPRPQSRPAVEKAHSAGINVYMLTGDHKKTAGAIAKQVSIIENEAVDRVMIGSEFEQTKVVGDLPKVVARCNPNTKIKMIDDLHSRDRFVCMTGDGVNDAPAIKKSDVGVAMGQNGSEVTKDSADIVLLDDNFGTIIVAIEEGRRVFANIGKIMLHLLTNGGALMVVLVFGLVYSFFVDEGIVIFPLSPMQILWLNVVTDTPVNAALGSEPAAPDIMAHPPRRKGEGIFNAELLIDVMFYAITAGVLTLANFGITLFTADDGPNVTQELYGEDVSIAAYRARGCAFISLVFIMLVHALNCTHPKNSMLMYRGKNIWLWGTIIVGSILVIPVLYIPWVNVHVFHHYNLTWVEWIQVFAAVALFAIGSEIYKLFKRCFFGFYRNGHYLIHLAERTTNSIADMNRLMIIQTERTDTEKKEETTISLV